MYYHGYLFTSERACSPFLLSQIAVKSTDECYSHEGFPLLLHVCPSDSITQLCYTQFIHYLCDVLVSLNNSK